MMEILIVMFGYLISFIFGVGIIAFFQADFFISFLKVKASRGSKILIRVRDSLRDYYRVGVVEDELLVFTDVDKQVVRVKMFKTALYRTLNVNAVDYDGDSGSLLSRDYKFQSGYDPKKFNNLLTRALTGPDLMNKEQKIILMILFGIAAGVGVTLFLVFGMSAEVTQCINNIPSVVGEL